MRHALNNYIDTFQLTAGHLAIPFASRHVARGPDCTLSVSLAYALYAFQKGTCISSRARCLPAVKQSKPSAVLHECSGASMKTADAIKTRFRAVAVRCIPDTASSTNIYALARYLHSANIRTYPRTMDCRATDRL